MIELFNLTSIIQKSEKFFFSFFGFLKVFNQNLGCNLIGQSGLWSKAVSNVKILYKNLISHNSVHLDVINLTSIIEKSEILKNSFFFGLLKF